MSYNHLIKVITIIFSVVICLICYGFIHKKQYKFLIETIVFYILYLIFLILQHRLNFSVKPFIIILILLTVIGNNFIGQYLNVYNRSKYYDRFLHAFGSFSFALFVYSVIYNIIVPPNYPWIYTSIFIANIGISLGCIVEIYEFFRDTTSHSKNQHGLRDTNFDLISNIIGGVLAGIISNFIFL